MLMDRYGYEITADSDKARDAYVAGVDLLPAATDGAEQEFRRAIACDEGFALAHAGLARVLQVYARTPEARAAMARARDLSSSLPSRERGHVAMLSHLVEGNGVAALAAAREHLQSYPRDAMVLSPCTSTLGLIGLSGRTGREAELLALLDGLADAYGDDWWFGGMHAFAKIETETSPAGSPPSSDRWRSIRAMRVEPTFAPTLTTTVATADRNFDTCAIGCPTIRGKDRCIAI